MTAATLYYEIRRRINNINSNERRQVHIEEIHSVANEAYQIMVENMVDLAELNPKLREDLRPLERKKASLSFTCGDKCCIAAYPDDYYRRLNQKIVASRSDCPNREMLVHMVQADDLNYSLQDPFWKPSFEWEETIADDGEDGLYIYHNGDFDIEEVIIDYYRKPGTIAFPSCVRNSKDDEEGSGSYVIKGDQEYTVDIDPELTNNFQMRKVADIAALIIHRDILDPGQFQTQLGKIIQTQQIYYKNI